MSNDKGKEPAFPVHPGIAMADENYIGISKREYFAAMAMQGCITRYPQGELPSFEDIAGISIAAADALLDSLTQDKKNVK